MIDGYCHCGVSKYLPLEDVRAALEANGVERAVLVQHLGEFDNAYLASIARAHPETFRCVALVDARGDWTSSLAAVVDSGAFRGLRIPRQTLLERLDLCRAAADAGLVLIVDPSGGIAECIPQLTRLLDGGTSGVAIAHLGYPPIEDGRVVGGTELFQLVQAEDVRVMLSGQSMWLAEPYTALDELTREVVAAFGPTRIIWGSNFPVCGDVDAYRRDLARVVDGRWGWTKPEIEQTVHGNAQKLWFD